MSAHAAKGLREDIDRFEAAGRLRRIAREVSPRFEACAYAAEIGNEHAVLFERVAGSPLRVAMNTTASRGVIAASLGVETADFAEHYLSALTHPIAPVESGPERGTPAVQEIVFRGDEINLAEQLPILTHHENDAGPYLTSGVVIGEHEGLRNLSYHRMQVRGPRRTGIVVVQRHLHRMLDAADAENRPFPVAVAIGLDAGMYLAAGTSGSAAPYGFDEFGIVGALRGEAVELVPAVSVPLHVPSCAEIIIEGHILPNLSEPEGPFAEFDGNYESGEERVFEASAITMRCDAIYHGLATATNSQLNIMGLPNEAVLLRAVRAVVPGVRAVRVTLGGLRKFHAVISIEKQIAGDPADAIIAAFAGHRDLKQVTIVDHDIDISDPLEVERAVAIYFQPHTGLHVFTGGRGNPVDRSLAPDGTTSRMGIDATRPAGSLPPTLARVPGRENVRL